MGDARYVYGKSRYTRTEYTSAKLDRRNYYEKEMVGSIDGGIHDSSSCSMRFRRYDRGGGRARSGNRRGGR